MQEFAAVTAVLEQAGVEATLVKGPAMAAFYPEPGLRPYGDLDYYVPPGQEEAAQRALLALPDRGIGVEVHADHSFPCDYSVPEMLARGRKITLGGTAVRTLRLEDHLRVLCLHLLCHGAWRPIWLCDIGVVLEDLPDSFDWDLLLSGRPLYVGWIRTVLELAVQVLDARPDRIPEAARVQSLPGWLTTALYRQWARGTGLSTMGRFGGLGGVSPAHWLALAASRWSNPIEASVGLRAPFNGFPRFPLQLAHTTRRAAEWVFLHRRTVLRGGQP